MLFHNNRDGTFTDVTDKAGVANERWGFGVAVGNYDNDGWAGHLHRHNSVEAPSRGGKQCRRRRDGIGSGRGLRTSSRRRIPQPGRAGRRAIRTVVTVDKYAPPSKAASTTHPFPSLPSAERKKQEGSRVIAEKGQGPSESGERSCEILID